MVNVCQQHNNGFAAASVRSSVTFSTLAPQSTRTVAQQFGILVLSLENSRAVWFMNSILHDVGLTRKIPWQPARCTSSYWRNALKHARTNGRYRREHTVGRVLQTDVRTVGDRSSVQCSVSNATGDLTRLRILQNLHYVYKCSNNVYNLFLDSIAHIQHTCETPILSAFPREITSKTGAAIQSRSV